MKRLAALLLLAAAGAPPVAAREIPRPRLDEMEPHVQRQLRDARAEVDALLADAGTAGAPLAAALGLMGQLYHAYDLNEPAEACYERAAALAPEEHRWHYYLGLLRQRSGRHQESMAALERALELAPSHAATILRLADQERAADRLDRAEELYRRLLEQPQAAAAGHLGLGQAATARGDHAAAARHLEQALATQPSATRLHYLLAIAYRRLGDLERARQQIALQGAADVAFPDPLLAELSSLASGAAVSLQRGYYAAAAGFDEAAIEDYRRAVASDPSNPEARRSLAGALARSGDHDGAIAELQALLEIDPNPAGAHFSLAEALTAAGSGEEALTHYQAAVDLAPDFRNFRLALARALIGAGRLDQAATHLLQLLESDRQDVEARIDLGEVLLVEGEVEAAESQFRTVVGGDATPRQRAAAHHGLARARSRVGDVAGALEQYRLALELVPERSDIRLAQAGLLGQAGRFSEAATAFRGAIELAPEDERARLGEATALLLAGRTGAAVAALDEGVTTLPESVELQDTLARLLAAAPEQGLRDGARALALAEGIFQRQPTLRHAETLAMALAETGRFDEAVALQERIVAEASRLGDAALVAGAEQVLAAYRRGEPYRLR